MKTKIFNSLIVSLLVVFAAKSSSAQDLSALFYGVNGGGAVKNVCYTDGFGYVWSITGTNIGGSNWTLSGSVAVTGLGNWAISGSGNSSAKTISMTATNPNGDNCQSASDNFTYTGNVSGKNIAGNWVNDCGLSGTFEGSYVAGSCGAPIQGKAITYGAPSSSKADLFNMLAAGATKHVCYTDGFGYVWDITGTNIGGSNWNLSGSVAVTGLGNWAISGSGNSSAKTIDMTATNPNGDNCQSASDNFTYTGNVSGKNIAGNWVNDCGLSGTFEGSYVNGSCGAPTGKIISYGAPANSKGDIFNMLAAGATKHVCFTDGFGYVWDITGTHNGGCDWTLSGSVAVTGLGNWAISGSGNSCGKTIDMTATNPNGDNCQSASDNFTYTGNVSGNNISGNWVNDCGLSGTFAGSYANGSCGAPIGSIIKFGAPANAKANDISVNPNPVVNYATIIYSTYKTDQVKVSIMDNYGQLVKTLFSGTLQSGTHSVSWDATNQSGAKVRSGIYMLNVQTSTGTMVHSISVGQ